MVTIFSFFQLQSTTLPYEQLRFEEFQKSPFKNVVVNVENLRLYEPPLIEYQRGNVQIPSIEYFSLEYLEELQQDTILDRRTRTSKRGNVEYLCVGLKGKNPSKAKWIEIGRVRELYPHMFVK